ncbi:MAG: Gfo/Idh/MocA family oxidoreductase, partial [Flavihumibacter sp.]|nr:Gfo/Idh/MocA family oxidoreductase [Flavihumibacter sp.]
MNKNLSLLLLCLVFSSFTSIVSAQPQEKLKVLVVGMTHDHVHGILQFYKQGRVIITGIVESNPELIARYKKSYQLPDALFFNNISYALKTTKPQVALAFNAINEHLAVVEACLPQGIPVMVEKPLAT